MIALTDITPYTLLPVPWDETTMPVNIGGDARRSVALYSDAGADCDGIYSIWGKDGDNPWVRIGDTVTLAASAKGQVIVNMEVINCFNKLYVCHDGASNADNWFLASGGNMGES